MNTPHVERESIVEWISRIGVRKFAFHFVFAPIWNFSIDRICHTLEGLAYLADAIGI